MKELLGEGFLLNRWTGEPEKALIFQGLDDKNLEDFEKSWKPVLNKRAAQFGNWDDQAKGNVQDAHWDWVGKAKQESVLGLANQCHEEARKELISPFGVESLVGSFAHASHSLLPNLR